MRIWQATAGFFAVAFLAISAAADGTQGITATTTTTTITIGNLGPFSGPASVFTPLNYRAVAYLRYINDQGGVDGRKFTAVFADDSRNEANGIAAAKNEQARQGRLRHWPQPESTA
jgi:branched-chain amino acid transport system substrate-binding protein